MLFQRASYLEHLPLNALASQIVGIEENTLAQFPKRDALRVHFAHPAYQLADRFALRNTGIEHFQTFNLQDTQERIKEGDVFVCSGFWQNDYLETAPNIRFVQVCAVGFDQFDQAAMANKGVKLANGAGVNANAVSDHAFALILGLTRKIHESRDNQAKAFWRGMISDMNAREEELPGKTLLIYGTGAIGGRIASLAKAFGMSTIGVRRDAAKNVAGVDEMHASENFVSLLPRADIVVLACPLNDATRGLMNAEAFAAMKNTAYFVNVARGGCMIEADVVAAIRSGQIAGAGIDVTDPEPLPEKSELWGLSQVILTSHTGGETRAYEDNVVDVLIENLNRLLDGREDLKNQIV